MGSCTGSNFARLMIPKCSRRGTHWTNTAGGLGLPPQIRSSSRWHMLKAIAIVSEETPVDLQLPGSARDGDDLTIGVSRSVGT